MKGETMARQGWSRGGRKSSRAVRRPKNDLSVTARGALAAALLVLAVGGCSESLKQYTLLGQWRNQSTQSDAVILSGSADRDAAAYSESSKELSVADWCVLGEIAPRPV